MILSRFRNLTRWQAGRKKESERDRIGIHDVVVVVVVPQPDVPQHLSVSKSTHKIPKPLLTCMNHSSPETSGSRQRSTCTRGASKKSATTRLVLVGLLNDDDDYRLLSGLGRRLATTSSEQKATNGNAPTDRPLSRSEIARLASRPKHSSFDTRQGHASQKKEGSHPIAKPPRLAAARRNGSATVSARRACLFANIG
jgi:hypothetical protein